MRRFGELESTMTWEVAAEDGSAWFLPQTWEAQMEFLLLVSAMSRFGGGGHLGTNF